MKTKKYLLPLALIMLLTPLTGLAASPEVPHYVNFQSVLRDDSGNLIEDGFVDLEFKILDQDGDQLYYEQQPGVQVVRSSVNVLIGEGIVPGSSPSAPTGGLPLVAVNPASGTKSIQIKIGSNLASEPMELGSVPFAYYAERALGLVDTITAAELPPAIATDVELVAAIAAEVAARTAADTTLQTNITTEAGTRSTADTTLQGNIDSEASTRSSADTGLQGQINNLSTTVSNHETRIVNLELGATLTPKIVLSADINGSTGSLNAEFNVGSVVRDNTGRYTITFATAMANANYVVVGSGEEDGPSEGVIVAVAQGSKTASSFSIRTVNMSDTYTDTRITLAVISIP